MSDHHDQLDPAETLMREVGAQLRQVRLDRGEALDDVGQQLRIKSTYLLGIEQGDLSAMPGRTYALGFLRSYADYLGFDGDDLITQIKSSVANLTDRTRLRMRTPLPESRLPKTPILALSLAAVAGIYAGWSYVNHGSQLVIETVAEVPASLRDLAAGALREPDRRHRHPGCRCQPGNARESARTGRADRRAGPVCPRANGAAPAAGSSSGLSLPSSEPSAPAPPARRLPARIGEPRRRRPRHFRPTLPHRGQRLPLPAAPPRRRQDPDPTLCRCRRSRQMPGPNGPQASPRPTRWRGRPLGRMRRCPRPIGYCASCRPARGCAG